MHVSQHKTLVEGDPGMMVYLLAWQVLGQALDGFMHAGGLLADALVLNQTAASLRSVFSPKVSSLFTALQVS